MNPIISTADIASAEEYEDLHVPALFGKCTPLVAEAPEFIQAIACWMLLVEPASWPGRLARTLTQQSEIELARRTDRAS